MKKVIEYVNEVTKWLISKPEISHIYCDWTVMNSLFYLLKVDECNIYLEIFFDNEGRDDLEDGVETVVNIFRNKEHELAYAGTLKECLAQIKELKI